MRKSSIISFVVAFFFAIIALFGVREFLAQQEARLANASQVQEIVELGKIVVANEPLRFGKLIERSNLREIDWPTDNVPEGAFSSIEELFDDEGKPRYVMTAIERGEPVLTTKITGPGQRATLSAALEPGMKAVSIRVNDVLGVAGFVLPGDRVDVLLTRTQRNVEGGSGIFSDILLQGVRVLAIDQLADERSDKPSVVRTVTFEVSTLEAQKLTLAMQVGTLSLALRNVASSDVEEVAPVGVADLGGGPTAEALYQEKLKEVGSVENIVDERLSKLRAELNRNTETKVETPVQRRNPLASIGVYRGVSERVEYKVKKQEDPIFIDDNEQQRLVKSVVQ